MTATEDRASPLQAIDLVIAALSIPPVLFIIAFPFAVAPHFQQMFAEFGGELPGLTRLALTAWCPLLVAAMPVALLAGSVFTRTSAQSRRAGIFGSFLLGVAASAALLVAVYLPLFSVAGSVR